MRGLQIWAEAVSQETYYFYIQSHVLALIFNYILLYELEGTFLTTDT